MEISVVNNFDQNTANYDSHGLRDDALIEAVQIEASRWGIIPAIVLVGGSYNEGFATATSDYDLVVIHTTNLPPALTSIWVQEKKIEIILYSWDDYIRLAVEANRQSIDGSLYNFLDLRRRLLCSKVILGHKAHLETMDQVDHEAFRVSVFNFHATLAKQSFNDFRGMILISGHVDDQYIRLRNHLERVIDSLLIVLGDYYFRPKWRCARIRRTFNNDERLTHLVDLMCSSLSGRILLSENDGSKIFKHLSFTCILAEYLSWFYDDWQSILELEDIKSLIKPKEQGLYCSIFRLPNRNYSVQSLGSAFMVPPEVAHGIYLAILGFPAPRQEELNAKFYERLVDRGVQVVHYSKRGFSW